VYRGTIPKQREKNAKHSPLREKGGEFFRFCLGTGEKAARPKAELLAPVSRLPVLFDLPVGRLPAYSVGDFKGELPP